ncbi:hypothetical protein ACM26V_22510 [Salipaludibacillus sp. HK11]|uniref:hypothetical protein n=1 Tax=Salipaludibacillus sp. HK11 TaxID=3394320 RepID=UPI0039FD921F
MHILSGLALIMLNTYYKTWRRIRDVWPGIVYVVFFNGLFYVLTKNMNPSPWVFNSKQMSPKTLKVYHLLVIMPLLLLLFLSNSPRSLSKQISYILKWTVGSSLIEAIGNKLHAISFFRKWTIGWSALIYVSMYTFSLLILVKPVLTMSLSIMSTFFFVKQFNVPIASLKSFLLSIIATIRSSFYY